MIWLVHLVIAAGYLAVALAFAWLAPAQLAIPAETARWIAAAIALVGALVQSLTTALLLAARVGRLEERTAQLIRQHGKVAAAVSELERHSESEADRNRALVDELKVLQTLLAQALARRGAGKVNETAGAPARPEAGGAARQDGGEPVRRPDPARAEPLPIEEYDEESLLRIIRVALNENRVDLYLQPIVALPSRRHMHYECFSRVRDEENRLVYPKDFLPLATSSGLIGTVDNLLLFRLIQLVRKLGRRKPEARFFCNIAEGSIRDREFFPQFVDYMVANRDFADRFVFEFRADSFAAIDRETERHLDMLIRSGYRFSLDGVSSPAFEPERLAVRGVGFVKIPRELLRDRMAEWAHELRRRNILPVAERVESESDVVGLIEQEIPLAQGFLFGEPRLARELPM
ncbi:MAG: diguanylate phosphodiesterase [Rhodothalassiaceae bacterium]|nr:MAG: diguanylate phosphodiesterase [Rhodothalassiaceae bacterium]